MMTLFLKLLMAHALTDFPLQSDSMAKGKNRYNKPNSVPTGQKLTPCWIYWLSAHALINGAGVYVVTQRADLSVIEVCCHWIIDFMKCENVTNPHVDQALHIATKILYVVVIQVGVR